MNGYENILKRLFLSSLRGNLWFAFAHGGDGEGFAKAKCASICIMGKNRNKIKKKCKKKKLQQATKNKFLLISNKGKSV